MTALRLDAKVTADLRYAHKGLPGEAWMFGSRVDPRRRGGDVDVLVRTDRPAFEVSQRVATRFFSRRKDQIDVVVFDPARLTAEQRAFLDHIQRVRLH